MGGEWGVCFGTVGVSAALDQEFGKGVFQLGVIGAVRS